MPIADVVVPVAFLMTPITIEMSAISAAITMMIFVTGEARSAAFIPTCAPVAVFRAAAFASVAPALKAS